MKYQEDAEALDHERKLIEAEHDRRKRAPSAPLAPDEYPFKPLCVTGTTDEFGMERWFVEDVNGDWISEPFDTFERAVAERDLLEGEIE